MKLKCALSEVERARAEIHKAAHTFVIAKAELEEKIAREFAPKRKTVEP